MKVRKGRKVVMQKRTVTALPEEVKEKLWLFNQLKEREREMNPDQFYVDVPFTIWDENAIVIR